jgi:predicted ATP-grasp superfamily ATP-dependent carboligase
MHPAGFGAGSVHESVDVPQTLELTTSLLDAADFVGIALVEAKRHAETGEMVLIEVNVRLPQGFGLGDAAGTDASWRLYATLAGLPLAPQPRPLQGVKVVVPSLEPRAIVGNLRDGTTTLREVVGSYRGVRGFSGLTPRDPVPVASLALRHLTLARRRWKRR